MFPKWFKPWAHSKLEIYMKSGNIIELDHVLDWKITNNNDQVINLIIHQSVWAKYKLAITSIDLKQIECVVSL